VSLAILPLVWGCLFLSWFRHPCGILHWDGQAWSWIEPDAEHSAQRIEAVELALDLQRCMLVRVRREACRPQWLWLEAPLFDGPWLSMRRALVFAKQADFFNQTLEREQVASN
jgi:hypothetical protein